ncbi:MAG: single-stranded-DNA-specific exonuclease RecJ [Pseudanabaena sp. ELA607]
MAEISGQTPPAYGPRYEWRFLSGDPAPSWLIEQVGQWAAQLLWQRGQITPEAVQSFINPDHYTPTSGWAFGAEMTAAVNRLQLAHEKQETLIIWGDFDSDGITATAVLWEGLNNWFPQKERLHFYIPDRLQESHGLSVVGLDFLRQQFPEAKLIVTCDTGSSNYDEILYAQDLGFEIIVTDHHTLPPERPPVVALINSRNFAPDHPLGHLSGVAVAYKLLEVFYEVVPHPPEVSCEQLLDLVAIGLIADLVQLQGDCRYLAQKGMDYLQKQLRTGLVTLAQKCRNAGDRARDISYGIAPRLNAASRIWGKVDDCIELLTTKNKPRAKEITERLEIANTERKDLQQQTKLEIEKQLQHLDRATTGVILLADRDWSVGILGLVAGELVQEYQRPVILCTIDGDLAKGSARAPVGVDLYSLLQGQGDLLTKFGGHPMAGGLVFPVVHLPVLQEALNQNFWQRYQTLPKRELVIDLTVKLEDVNERNAKGLQQLEPYGMGNPPPNFRICQVLIAQAQYYPSWVNRKGARNTAKLNSGYTEFKLLDPHSDKFIKGRSWQHRPADFPSGLCDVVVNLTDFGLGYRVLLLDVMVISDGVLPATTDADTLDLMPLQLEQLPQVLDYRTQEHPLESELVANEFTASDYAWCRQCPSSWHKFHDWLRQGATSHGLVLAYPSPYSGVVDAGHTWRLLVGIAKYLRRTGAQVSWQQIGAKLGIDQPRLLWQGLQALRDYGYGIVIQDHDTHRRYDFSYQDLVERHQLAETSADQNWQISCEPLMESLYYWPDIAPNLEIFWAGVAEYRFQQQFFDSQWQNYQKTSVI